MKFRIERATKGDQFPFPVAIVGKNSHDEPVYGIELTTIEELAELATKSGYGVLLTMPGNQIVGYEHKSMKPPEAEGWLTIYDDYLE